MKDRMSGVEHERFGLAASIARRWGQPAGVAAQLQNAAIDGRERTLEGSATNPPAVMSWHQSSGLKMWRRSAICRPSPGDKDRDWLEG